jgi:hypothetical protein
MLEEIAHHDAAGGLIAGNTDELCPLVGRANGAFGELAPDVVRLLDMAARELLPNLLLAHMIVRHRECHELFQRHAILGVDVEEAFGNGSEFQSRLDDRRIHKEPSRDLLLAQPLLAQGLEGAKLVEGVQGNSLDVLGQRILLGEPASRVRYYYSTAAGYFPA